MIEGHEDSELHRGDDAWNSLTIINILRHFHDQFAAKGEVRALAAFEILRRSLRQRSDENRQRDGGIAVYVGAVSAAG